MSQFDLFVEESETEIKPIGYRKTLTKYQPPEREFVAPDTSASFIHWLFRYRCVECKRAGQEINEIIPRSRSKKSILDWRNRVLLCKDCHYAYHQNGVTDDKIVRMQKLRTDFLRSFGRLEYLGDA